jgi:hypothetical protein
MGIPHAVLFLTAVLLFCPILQATWAFSHTTITRKSQVYLQTAAAHLPYACIQQQQQQQQQQRCDVRLPQLQQQTGSC